MSFESHKIHEEIALFSNKLKQDIKSMQFYHTIHQQNLSLTKIIDFAETS